VKDQPRDAITIPIIPVLRALIGIIVIGTIALMVSIIFAHRDQLLGRSTIERYIDPNAFQVVFLTGQLSYFGHLRVDGDVYLLTDVYYIDATDPQNTRLVKRGGEVLGSREPMLIPQHQILVVENLRDDSTLVTAIRGLRSGQTAAPALLPPAVPSPSATR
jgi:hypothetical protein